MLKESDMKLWILRPVEGLEEKDDPWKPWFDKAFGFIVRASSEEEARQIAHDNAGDENYESPRIRAGSPETRRAEGKPWLSARYSTCTVLQQEGEAGPIMEDFHAA